MMANEQVRRVLAECLAYEVLPQEKAKDQAKNATTSELIQRIGVMDLTPSPTKVEMTAYMVEAERRIRKARAER